MWDWTEFGKKTGWQWIELLSALAIPVVLAIAGYWFTMQQDARQQQIEDQRAQDAALQAYLDQMSTLMIGQESLRDSGEGSEVRALARARTLTVLRRLGPAHKGSVVQFLHEAVLIQPAHQVGNDQPIGEPIIKLTGADLSEADLSGADLTDADLNDASLIGTNLSDANLSGAEIRGADLRETNLYGASLSGASLSGASLSGASLSGASLSEADLSEADLSGANLHIADLTNADLHLANLGEADLSYAELFRADLSSADLSYADLSGASLSTADLSRASGVTNAELEQAFSLEGATMPNGQKYEEWLKSKGRGEEGENSGPS